MQILYEPVAVKHFKIFFYPLPQRGDKPLGKTEKAKKTCQSRNIFKAKSTQIVASADCEEIKFNRRIIMKMTNFKRILSLCLLTVLIAAMALVSAGCGDNNKPTNTETPLVTTSSTGVTVLGKGSKTFDFTVTDYDGVESKFEIHTDKETVGEALMELGLISGDEGEFGLYVKTVNGITADFDKDGKYWAFYIDGEYALTGVDATTIEEGKTYAFKVE